MEKKGTMLVLAVAAAIILAASSAYAMGRQTPGVGSYHPNSSGSGMGPSMMGGSSYRGGMMGGQGMMGGFGMMGEVNDTSSMSTIRQHMYQCWNSTSIP